MKKLLFLFTLLLLFNSCYHCESEDLPVLYIRLHTLELPDYVRVYNQHVEFSGNEYNGLLPLTLNSDTTSFYFETTEGEQDTLSIRYNRTTAFESTGCGFFFSVSDPQVLPSTTFPGVEVEMFKGDVEVQL